jgi:hypothetical protein
MELRTEPRFGTHASAVIEVVRDKVYTYDTTITEVSGLGLRMEMSKELAIGETIRLLVNDYQMYAQVRRCVPSESGFIIGVERIDAWDGPPPEDALIAQKTVTAAPVKVVGRPKLRKPVDNLHAAALRELFADSRWRTKGKKYQAISVIAGCVVVAGWAGFGGVFFHGKAPAAAALKTESAKQLPGAPKSAAVIAAPQAAATVAVTPVQKAEVMVPPVQKAAVVAPPVQKAVVVATPVQKAVVVAPPVQKAAVVAPRPVAARPSIVPASRISINASDRSWVTACVDGAKVLDMLLVKGYVGQIPFAREATLRFGNAGAIELAVGSQPPAKIGSLGEVRTVRVTSTGYTLITLPSALNCNIH